MEQMQCTLAELKKKVNDLVLKQLLSKQTALTLTEEVYELQMSLKAENKTIQVYIEKRMNSKLKQVNGSIALDGEKVTMDKYLEVLKNLESSDVFKQYKQKNEESQSDSNLNIVISDNSNQMNVYNEDVSCDVEKNNLSFMLAQIKEQKSNIDHQITQTDIKLTILKKRNAATILRMRKTLEALEKEKCDMSKKISELHPEESNFYAR